MRLLIFPRYGELGASSRLRIHRPVSLLGKEGLDAEVFPLIDDALLKRKYGGKGYGVVALLGCYLRRAQKLFFTRNAHLVLIEKELFPFVPAFIELFFLRKRRFIVDYDDAIFHNYDLHSSLIVRAILGKKIDVLMKRAAAVTCGSEYLRERAFSAGATVVRKIPTTVATNCYSPEEDFKSDGVGDPVRLVWIGSPSTARYLQLLREPLRELSRRYRFVFRVIGVSEFSVPNVEVEILPWSEETEAEFLCGSDIGVMPLIDSPWEKGKCGYKIIQYMAAALPVVASLVGENSLIVRDGVDGFLVRDTEGWIRSLGTLLEDQALRRIMGIRGRSRARLQYDITVAAKDLQSVLWSAVE